MASEQHIYRSGRVKLVFSRTVSSPPHSLPFARMRGTKKGHTSLLIRLNCDVECFSEIGMQPYAILNGGQTAWITALIPTDV